MLVRRIVDIRAVEEGAGRDIVEDNLPCNERVARHNELHTWAVPCMDILGEARMLLWGRMQVVDASSD